MIQTYRYVSTFRAISSWTLAFPGYLYNQRYPYVEVVIRINFNIKHSFIMLQIPRTPNQASTHLLLHHLLKQLQCHGPLVRRRHRCGGRAEGHHVGTHLGEKGQTPLPLTTSDFEDTISGKTQHGCGCPTKMGHVKDVFMSQHVFSCAQLHFWQALMAEL